jgi:hypothetical protein
MKSLALNKELDFLFLLLKYENKMLRVGLRGIEWDFLVHLVGIHSGTQLKMCAVRSETARSVELGLTPSFVVEIE